MRINKSTVFSQIKLGENSKVPNRVQVLRVGKFNHPNYGKFEITKQILSEMKSNFDKKVRGIDTAFDYYHASDEDASAWVKSLELADGGSELWANVDWTPKAEKKLAERELRYFSPDFAFSWKDPEGGVTHKNVLFGGGLTNRPFVKEMQPIVAAETAKQITERRLKMDELEKAQKEIEGLKAQLIKLGEEKNAEVALKLAEGGKAEGLKKKIAELQAELDKLQGENKIMADKVKLSEESAKTAKKEADFNVMLTEGKAVAAQKDAYMKDDFASFVKLAQPVNLKAAGSSKSTTTSTDDDEDDAVIKLAEKIDKENPRLGFGAAMSQARRELKEAKQ